MKVSIVTVVYNGSATIADAIRSVVAQSYPDIEYIVIDGASKDATLDIVRSFGNSVTRLVSEKDKGLYDAMNKGVGMATGDIIGILNADDFYLDGEVIAKVVRRFQDAACDGVYGDLLYVDPVDTDKIVRTWKSGQHYSNSFLYGWMPPHPTFFVKRTVYEKYGNFNLTLKSAADYEIMLRFIYKYKIKLAYLPEVIVKMRTGGTSNSSLKNRLRANGEDRMAWQINGLKPLFFTTWLKPIRKISQFIIK